LSQVGAILFSSFHVEFIFLLRTGTYGLTTIRMENGEKYDLPKQIIQSQRTHALVHYTMYCDETGFQSLGKSKLLTLLTASNLHNSALWLGLVSLLSKASKRVVLSRVRGK
jgi:hypothetical protein